MKVPEENIKAKFHNLVIITQRITLDIYPQNKSLKRKGGGGEQIILLQTSSLKNKKILLRICKNIAGCDCTFII